MAIEYQCKRYLVNSPPSSAFLRLHACYWHTRKKAIKICPYVMEKKNIKKPWRFLDMALIREPFGFFFVLFSFLYRIGRGQKPWWGFNSCSRRLRTHPSMVDTFDFDSGQRNQVIYFDTYPAPLRYNCVYVLEKRSRVSTMSIKRNINRRKDTVHITYTYM